MRKLEKICDVLGMKRSRAEREVAASKMELHVLDRKIRDIEILLNQTRTNVYSGAPSDNPICDAVTLETWRDMVLGHLRALEIEKKDILERLMIEKQVLRKNIIKEDVVNKVLKEKLRAHRLAYQEEQSSTCLENWISSKL